MGTRPLLSVEYLLIWRIGLILWIRRRRGSPASDIIPYSYRRTTHSSRWGIKNAGDPVFFIVAAHWTPKKGSSTNSIFQIREDEQILLRTFAFKRFRRWKYWCYGTEINPTGPQQPQRIHLLIRGDRLGREGTPRSTPASPSSWRALLRVSGLSDPVAVPGARLWLCHWAGKVL